MKGRRSFANFHHPRNSSDYLSQRLVLTIVFQSHISFPWTCFNSFRTNSSTNNLQPTVQPISIHLEPTVQQIITYQCIRCHHILVMCRCCAAFLSCCNVKCMNKIMNMILFFLPPFCTFFPLFCNFFPHPLSFFPPPFADSRFSQIRALRRSHRPSLRRCDLICENLQSVKGGGKKERGCGKKERGCGKKVQNGGKK